MSFHTKTEYNLTGQLALWNLDLKLKIENLQMWQSDSPMLVKFQRVS